MAEYKINIINNGRQGYADPLYEYIDAIVGKRFKGKGINLKKVNHGDMSRYLRKHGHLEKYESKAHIASGGQGHWESTGKYHVAGDSKLPEKKRANSVYEHLVGQGEKLHGVCEGAKAIAQVLGAYSINSGKFNIDKAEGLHHKYLIPAKHKSKLGKVSLSKEKHQGTNYIMEFEKGNVSGTQYHPEKRQSPEDEETVVRFLEKATGLKASSLEERVEESSESQTSTEEPALEVTGKRITRRKRGNKGD